MIVSKFGGTSMSSPESIRLVASILARNSDRKVCVVSAPGKLGRHAKVTDLLLQYELEACLERMFYLVYGLELPSSVMSHAREKLIALESLRTIDALLSFGEYMSAYILAMLTERRCIDACEVIHFEHNTVRVRIVWDPNEPVIVPGFYGFDTVTNQIKVFPRGGSDISAAYIAEALHATLYENWTDVDGVYDKDPQKHADAIKYDYLSYTELERIVVEGAQVFHPNAVHPAQYARIPIEVKSTFLPDGLGTIIS